MKTTEQLTATSRMTTKFAARPRPAKTRTVGATATVALLATFLGATSSPDSASAASSVWLNPGGGTNNGDWGDSTKWAGGIIADGAGFTATFKGDPDTNNTTVTIDAATGSRTIGIVDIGDTAPTVRFYIIASETGAETLTFDNNGSPARIVNSQSSAGGTGNDRNRISAGMLLSDDLLVNVTTGSQLRGLNLSGNIADAPSESHSITFSNAAVTGFAGPGGAAKPTLVSGNNTYTGGTTITSDAHILFNNTLGSGAGTGSVVVNSTGTVGGTGSFTGALTANASATVAPGEGNIESLGSGSITLDGATLAFELNLDDNTIDNNDADLLHGGAASALTLLNSPMLSLTDLGIGSILDLGEKVTLISYNGGWNGGTFDGLANGSMFTLFNNTWRINYADTTAGANFETDANGTAFVTLTTTAIPEPSTAVLLVLGASLAMPLRRKKI